MKAVMAAVVVWYRYVKFTYTYYAISAFHR